MSKTTLFSIVSFADNITCAGYEAEGWHFDNIGMPERRILSLTCDDDVEYVFADQEVELLDNGEILAYSDAETETDGKSIQYRLRLTVERALSLADVSSASAAT